MSHEEESLGEFIRRKRERLKLSVREMARQIEVSSTFLSKVERRGWKPGENKARRIAEVLDCDADVLLALADKISSDLGSLIKEMPPQRALLLRTSEGMTPIQVERAILEMEKIKQE